MLWLQEKESRLASEAKVGLLFPTETLAIHPPRIGVVPFFAECAWGII